MKRSVIVGVVGLAFAATAAFLWRGSSAAHSPEIATDSRKEADVAPVPATSSAATSRATSIRAALPPRGLAVTVVDPRGEAVVGAPVAFAVRRPNEPVDRWIELGRTTAPHGKLELADASERIAALRDEWGRDSSVGIALYVPGVPSAVVPLEPETLPAEGVRLVASGCGSVVARILDADGIEVRAAITVQLNVVDLRSRGERSTKKLEVDFDTGVARFAAVPLKRRLQASVELRDFRLDAQTVAGPERDGEVVEIVWRLPSSHPILTGTCIGEDATVVPRMPLCYSSSSVQTPWIVGFGRADAVGRFRLVLPSTLAGKALRDLEFREGSLGKPAGRGGKRPGMLDLVPGVTDLGTVSFTRLPILLSVVAMDASGQPLELYAWYRGLGLPGSNSLTARSFHAPLVRETAPGHVEFLGVADSVSLELLVGSQLPNAGKPSRVPVQVGARDVRIVATAFGSLAASLRGAEGMAARHELVIEGKSDSRPFPSLGDGRFTALEPGLYALRVRLPLERDPVLVIEHLQVEEGRPCADERLRTIDLRDHVRRIVLRATDPAGTPLRDLQVSALTENANVAPIGQQSTHAGALTLGLAKGAHRLLVEAPGHHGKTQIDPNVDTTVVLEPGTRVQVRLAVNGLPQGVQAFCTFQSARQDALFVAGISPLLRPGETVAAGTLVAGTYTSVCVLMCGTEKALLCRRPIVVSAQPDPQTIEIGCTDPELANALRELGY